ncbi:glutathione S-transferase family protein [Sphingomonas immobilis]|uniref:Glutathione S-transferase family protein n=1 Tax=Sphingomonas immobilis TaxID=3063997 RepID=A0ABT9A322_9SPHN|nr:glutathione S-transferase family protein [Sphingomonas sp. CA1-15]MDO7843381.1 glutathione S-transferase family protein [Sphingomonas sp. CA1-15]
MTITIFGSIGSRASRCLWTIEETGQPYQWVPISTLDGANRSSEYLAINPSGKIPAMTDDAVVMTESTAINLYIAQHYGQASLWPDDRAVQARILQWTFWSATEIEYYIGAIFPHLVMKSEEQRDQAFVDRLLGEMMPKFGELERALAGQEYVLGDFTLADINLVVQTLTITDRFGLTLDELPNIKAWTERCRNRPARRKVDALAAAARK